MALEFLVREDLAMLPDGDARLLAKYCVGKYFHSGRD